MVRIDVVTGEITERTCDVLVMKHAQSHHGADEAVAARLMEAGYALDKMSPPIGEFQLLWSAGALAADRAMFVGVAALPEFGYGDIRDFSRSALQELAARTPAARTIALTMHGSGYGLDEREAFNALIAGILDAEANGDVPPALCEIAIVEHEPGRAQRLSRYLGELGGSSANGPLELDVPAARSLRERISRVGYASDSKPHIFVAMPFSDEKNDVFNYGIQNAVQSAGLLCERIDQKKFTGNVLEQIKDRIDSAALVVADLSGRNANVYLEVGYAWGRKIPTVLLTDNIDELGFDVQSERCISYGSIKELEERLTAELRALR